MAKHASAARCARNKPRKRTVARRRQLHLLMLLPHRVAPLRRVQLPCASPRPQFGAPWMQLGGSPPQSTHPHGVDLWLQTSKRARRHLPRQHAGSVATLVRGTAVNGTRGNCVRLSTAESDVQRSGGHFQHTRHSHRLLRRGLFRLLFLFSAITCCKRPREHSGSCIDSTPGAVATPVLTLAVGSQHSLGATVRLSAEHRGGAKSSTLSGTSSSLGTHAQYP